MKVQPTIMERVELQRRWAAEQVHQAKVAKKRAAIKKLYEEQKDMARKQMLDEIDDVAANPNAADITKLADDATNLDADGMEDADDLFESEEDKSAFENMKDNDKDFGADMMELKERRLLNTRGTSIYHKLFTKYQKRVKALSIALQLHTVDRDVSEILPWLYISNKETASTISTLLKYNFTHILNVTHDVQSFFPHLFVYQRIPVKDSADSNMVDYFPKIVSFLQRVEKVPLLDPQQQHFFRLFNHRDYAHETSGARQSVGALYRRCLARPHRCDELLREGEEDPPGGCVRPSVRPAAISAAEQALSLPPQSA